MARHLLMSISARARTWLAATFVVGFFAVLLALTWNQAMGKALNHDENMYVASGVLLSRAGLLPYRDYPYFQMPLLTFVYAGLFALSSHLLLAARLFSVACALGSSAVLFYVAWRAFEDRPLAIRLAAGAAGALLFIMSPLFVYTSGLAWNHDLPVLLTLLAFAVLWRAAERGPGMWSLLASGILLGLAVESRLSFATLALPFLLAILLLPSLRPGRPRLVLAFVGGMIAALLPVVALFALAPGPVVFDNVTYHSVNARYWSEQGYTRAMDLPGKLTYLNAVAAEPGTRLLLLAVGLLLIVWLLAGRRVRWSGSGWVLFAAALVVCMLAGALSPSPTWYQYFYSVLPLVVLLGVLLAGGAKGGAAGATCTGVLVLAALGTCLLGIGSYLTNPPLLTPSAWVPEIVHREGVQVMDAAGQGYVLTLAPLFPLEGGGQIYGELAAGPFGVRNAPLLSPDDRREFDMPSLAELQQILNGQPPAAILTGPEAGLEGPLVNYGRRRGYVEQPLPGGDRLWVLPR